MFCAACLPLIHLQAEKMASINSIDFDAVPDAIFLSTQAIQRVIDSGAEGDTVQVPAGRPTGGVGA